MSYNYQPTKAPTENDRLILADQVANGATAASYQWPATPEEIGARINANNSQLAQAGATGINPSVQAALELKLDASEKGAPGGVAELNGDGELVGPLVPRMIQESDTGTLLNDGELGIIVDNLENPTWFNFRVGSLNFSGQPSPSFYFHLSEDLTVSDGEGVLIEFPDPVSGNFSVAGAINFTADDVCQFPFLTPGGADAWTAIIGTVSNSTSGMVAPLELLIGVDNISGMATLSGRLTLSNAKRLVLRSTADSSTLFAGSYMVLTPLP